MLLLLLVNEHVFTYKEDNKISLKKKVVNYKKRSLING